MKKLLPKSHGFTLIELLVVITILSILAAIGLVAFGGVQKNARDARRKGDIDAIAKALESNKTSGSSTYPGLYNNQFSSGSVPTDTVTPKYCIQTGSTSSATTWASTSTCPSGYVQALDATPTPGATSWIVCARLEESTDTILKTYCRVNSQ